MYLLAYVFAYAYAFSNDEKRRMDKIIEKQNCAEVLYFT